MKIIQVVIFIACIGLFEQCDIKENQEYNANRHFRAFLQKEFPNAYKDGFEQLELGGNEGRYRYYAPLHFEYISLTTPYGEKCIIVHDMKRQKFYIDRYDWSSYFTFTSHHLNDKDTSEYSIFTFEGHNHFPGIECVLNDRFKDTLITEEDFKALTLFLLERQGNEILTKNKLLRIYNKKSSNLNKDGYDILLEQQFSYIHKEIKTPYFLAFQDIAGFIFIVRLQYLYVDWHPKKKPKIKYLLKVKKMSLTIET